MHTRIRFRDFSLNPESYVLKRGSETVDLEPRTFELLTYLIRHRERVVSKQELLDELWSEEAVGDAVLFVRIGTLRRALGDDRHKQGVIRTVHRRGYQFVAPLSSQPAKLSPSPDLDLPFVGRAHELELFAADVAAALSGRGRAIFLSGEPGIGKTRLAAELADVARNREILVRVGRGSEVPGAPAFLPWAQILQAEKEQLGPDRFGALVGESLSELQQVAPRLAGSRPAHTPEALRSPEARFNLFDAVARFLRHAAAEQPRLLVLDDLHRADLSSLYLLQFLASELAELPLLLVGCYRPGELEGDRERSECIATTTRRASARSVALAGITRADVARLRAAAPDAASMDADELYALTSGNPFFVTQILSLEGSGDTRLGGGAEVRLPQNLRDAIAQQLAGFAESDRELLTRAAVLGREFEAAELSAMSGRSAVAVETSMETAIRAGIAVREASALRFTHILLRDSLYDQLPVQRRIELHAEAATALERLYSDEVERLLPRLAHHFCEAAPVLGSQPAVAYATGAADAAASAFAYDDAAIQYQRALDVLRLEEEPDPEQRCELLILLAASLAGADQRERARAAALRAARIARETGDGRRLARAALSIHPSLHAISMSPDDEINALHLEALDQLGDDEANLALRGQLCARLALEYAWPMPHDRRMELGREALDAGRRSGDLRTLASGAISRFVGNQDQREDQKSLVEQAAELTSRAQADRSQEAELMFRALRIHLLMNMGDAAGFDRELLEFASRARALRSPYFECFSLMAAGMRALMRARLDEAEEVTESFGRLANRLGDYRAQLAYVGQRTALLIERGKLEEGLTPVDRQSDFLDVHPAWLGFRAWASHRLGDPEGARELFERVAYRDFDRIVPDLTWLPCYTVTAELCSMLGDTKRATILYERLLPHADRMAVVPFNAHALGCPSRQLGMLARTLGDYERAERHLLHAFERDRELGANICAIRDRLTLAETYLARGAPTDLERALALANEARRDALARGLKALAAEIELLLQA